MILYYTLDSNIISY